MKPTQVTCSEGSINQIPPWTEIQGDIHLTPFYNVYDCMKKVVKELNDGKSCDFHSNQLCDHVLLTCHQQLVLWWGLKQCPSFPLHPDITKLPTRGPCSKYELDLEEGKFRGELELTFEADPFKVRGSSCMCM